MNYIAGSRNNFLEIDKTLSDGEYTGQVHIFTRIDIDHEWNNIETRWFEARISLAKERFDKTLFTVSRLIKPHIPALIAETKDKNDVLGITNWNDARLYYFQQTLRFLEYFGVNTADADADALTLLIARNNMSIPILDFTVNDGIPDIQKTCGYARVEELEKVVELFPDGSDYYLI